MGNAATYVTDVNGYNLTLYSAVSFALTQKIPHDVFIFCHGFQPEKERSVEDFFSRTAHRIIFKRIDNKKIEGLSTKGHVPKTAYLKIICVAELIKNYSRVLYADNDLLFFSSLELNSVQFDGCPVAAVMDIAECGHLTDPEFASTCRANGVSPRYFNSGLMLFDRLNWQESSVLPSYYSLLAEHQHTCKYKKHCRTNDQCVLNRVFENSWISLPFDYNMQACLKHSKHWTNASVRHYQGPDKFIPLKARRNDYKDARLVNDIEKILGKKGTKWSFMNLIVLSMNRIRLFKKIKKAERALAQLVDNHEHHQTTGVA